jgi:hypothetical protein
MFCLAVVVVCRCVSSTDVFHWDSHCSCTGVVCVLLACSVIEFPPCVPCFLVCECCVVESFKTAMRIKFSNHIKCVRKILLNMKEK